MGAPRFAKQPLAAISASSARIGGALSTYGDGMISGVNDPAKKIGVAVGMKTSEAARIMLGHR